MRRALLCACSDYRDPAFTPLKYPLNDVDEIQRLLGEPELCGFEEVEVLKDPAKGEVHEAVERLTADSGADDLILFYFSGHGKLAHEGSVALVLNDTKENRLLSTGLLDNELRVLFNASRARQRVIILDCCYSGAVGDEGFKRASGDAVEALAQQVKGTFVLAASTKFQPAMECEQSGASAFTSCLVEGVRSGAAAEKGTGCVTLSKLGEYLSREVPLRSNQQPKFWDFGGVGATIFSFAPKRFDDAWTEQTLKRLRQMMGKEQIDDHLFVELQKALRGVESAPEPEELRLIDDLAQRRVRPIPFLRKWEALRNADRRPAADSPPPSVAARETQSATGAQSSAETAPPEVLVNDGSVHEEMGAAIEEPLAEFTSQSEIDSSVDSPLDEYATGYDESMSETEAPEPNPRHLAVGILSLLLSLVLLFISPYDPIGALVGLIALAACWLCLWTYSSKAVGRGMLIVGALVILFVTVAPMIEGDYYYREYLPRRIGLFLILFAVLLLGAYWNRRE